MNIPEEQRKKLNEINVIGTTIEQSKELLKLGLPRETADLLYPFNTYNYLGVFGIPSVKEGCTKDDIENEQSIHCWSLNALLTVLQKANVWLCVQYLPITFDDDGKAINNVWDVGCEYSYLSFTIRNKNLFDGVYESVVKLLKIPDINLVKLIKK